jgi:hypothetical protein
LELGEDASVWGPFAGENGRTSIFDFVYQEKTRDWRHGDMSPFASGLRARYAKLLALKAEAPFAVLHSSARPSWSDLDGANWGKESSRFVASFVRFAQGRAYLVVINSDPFKGHDTTVHLTAERGKDSLGVLAALGVSNDSKRLLFREVLSHDGWEPKDPAVEGRGLPGWVLWRETGVPSGLYLGEVPPATVLVFEVIAI